MLHWLPGKHDTFSQCWGNVGPASQTVAQRYPNTVSMCRVCWLRRMLRKKPAGQRTPMLQWGDRREDAAKYESFISILICFPQHTTAQRFTLESCAHLNKSTALPAIFGINMIK